MKFKRVYCMGDTKKEDNTDFVIRYEFENGATIRPIYWGGIRPTYYDVYKGNEVVGGAQYFESAKAIARAL